MRLILPADGAHLPLIIKRIAVNLSTGGKTGMKAIRRRRALPDPDIGREHGIQRKAHLIRRNAARAVKMSAKPEGMNARIRSARPRDGDLLPRHPGKRLLQRLLNARPVDLPLPAAVRRAVIFDNELKTPLSLGRMIRRAGNVVALQLKLSQGVCPPQR